VTVDTTVTELKQLIVGRRRDCALYEIELIWSGMKLNEKVTLRECSLQDGTTISLALRIIEK